MKTAKSSSTKLTGVSTAPNALIRLTTLSQKITKGEFPARKVSFANEPSIDSEMALKLTIGTLLFTLGSQFKQDMSSEEILIEILWIISILSYFYLVSVKQQNKMSHLRLFLVVKQVSLPLALTLAAGKNFSYRFYIENQEQDALSNLLLTLIITALCFDKDIPYIKSCLVSQFLLNMFILGTIQVWFRTFDYSLFGRQIILFLAFHIFCQVFMKRLLVYHDSIEATIKQQNQEISFELDDIKNKLEQETKLKKVVPDPELSIHNSGGLIAKLKWLKFTLSENEKENFSPNIERKIGKKAYKQQGLNNIQRDRQITSEDCDILLRLIEGNKSFNEPLRTHENSLNCEISKSVKHPFAEPEDAIPDLRTEPHRYISKVSKFFDNPWNSFLEKNICTWSFDMLKFKDSTNGNQLIEFGTAIFKKFNILKVLNTDPTTVIGFLQEVSRSYLPNSFHNSIHAADVCNAAGYFLTLSEFTHNFDELEKSCLLISALVHDLGHPGLSNAFLVARKYHEALLYNDQSVLENFHAAFFFRVLQKPSCNILSNVTEKDYRYFRKLAISMIIDTDLARHVLVLTKFKSSLESMNLKEENDRFLTLSIAIKCADICHGAKDLDLHKRWSRRITEEFFLQGDKEREYNMPVTPLCNRQGNISKSQVDFLNFIVLPVFDALSQKFFHEQVRTDIMNLIKLNIQYWEQEIPNEERGEKNFLKDTEKVMENIMKEANCNKYKITH